MVTSGPSLVDTGAHFRGGSSLGYTPRCKGLVDALVDTHSGLHTLGHQSAVSEKHMPFSSEFLGSEAFWNPRAQLSAWLCRASHDIWLENLDIVTHFYKSIF